MEPPADVKDSLKKLIDSEKTLSAVEANVLANLGTLAALLMQAITWQDNPYIKMWMIYRMVMLNVALFLEDSYAGGLDEDGEPDESFFGTWRDEVESIRDEADHRGEATSWAKAFTDFYIVGKSRLWGSGAAAKLYDLRKMGLSDSAISDIFSSDPSLKDAIKAFAESTEEKLSESLYETLRSKGSPSDGPIRDGREWIPKRDHWRGYEVTAVAGSAGLSSAELGHLRYLLSGPTSTTTFPFELESGDVYMADILRKLLRYLRMRRKRKLLKRVKALLRTALPLLEAEFDLSNQRQRRALLKALENDLLKSPSMKTVIEFIRRVKSRKRKR
jgi:hypothetical protein